jgi:hypothetical protein
LSSRSRALQADGFEIDVIAKLDDVKDISNRFTLLDFIAKLCRSKYKDVLPLVDDLRPMRDVGGLSERVLVQSLTPRARALF